MYYVFKIFYLCVFMRFYCSLCKVLGRWSRDGPVLILTFVRNDYFLTPLSLCTIISYPHIRSERLLLIFEFLSYFCFGTLALLALILYLLYFKITGYILRIYKVM